MGIALFGEIRCHKTRFYQPALIMRGLAYTLAEVDKDARSAATLAALAGRSDKLPTFQIKGRKLRNPSLSYLDKVLASAGLYDPCLVVETKGRRFVRHMTPKDAFVSNPWQGERVVLGHIETDPSLCGSGLGTRFATNVFEHLETADHDIRLTCPCLRRVGTTRTDWREKFHLKDAT